MKFCVYCKDERGKNIDIHPVTITQNGEEAMDLVMTMENPLALRGKTWELVVECGFCDGINICKTEKSFEYENTHNGDYRVITYYITMSEE